MRVQLTKHACTLFREPGDKGLYNERAVSHAMMTLLRAQGIDCRRTRGPQGLTSCPSASILRIHDDGSSLWHERYAVETSNEAFNEGSVTFHRVAQG